MNEHKINTHGKDHDDFKKGKRTTEALLEARKELEETIWYCRPYHGSP